MQDVYHAGDLHASADQHNGRRSCSDLAAALSQAKFHRLHGDVTHRPAHIHHSGHATVKSANPMVSDPVAGEQWPVGERIGHLCHQQAETMPQVKQSTMLGGTSGATDEALPSSSGSLIMRMLAFKSQAATTAVITVNRGTAHASVERPQASASSLANAAAAAAAVAPSARPSAAAPSCGLQVVLAVSTSAPSPPAASSEPPAGAEGSVEAVLPATPRASAAEAVATGAAAAAAREPTGLEQSGPTASPASPQLQWAPAPAGSCGYSTSVTADLVEDAESFGVAPTQDVLDTAASLPSGPRPSMSPTQRMAEDTPIPTTQQTSPITPPRADTQQQHFADFAAAYRESHSTLAEAGAGPSDRRLTPSEVPTDITEESDVCCTTVTADLEISNGDSEGIGSGETAKSQLATAVSAPTEMPSAGADAAAAAMAAMAVPTEMAPAVARAGTGPLRGIRAIIDGGLGASESERRVVATCPIVTIGA